ncbi:MAG: M20/M25/M40 family metallo-hydrolase [Candidatus Pacebacteria bacterium]|nr:M20/M25/M40 family metallo-hydrolase [Candidatus Paceibacterota bacterium]
MSLQKNLEQLVKFKTVTGNYQECQAVLDWIKKEIKGLPLYIKQLNSNKFQSLVITTQKTKKPIMWLMAHLDVVPGKEELFVPQVKNSKMFGRGANDMKFAIACYLELLKELGNDLSKYNFGVMLTTDEEFGGFDGAGFLTKQGFVSQVVFLPDGEGAWQIEKSAKGVLDLLVESKGKSAHGSQPWLGKNAIENLLNFINTLKNIFPKEPCRIKSHYHATMNVGKIEGGEAINKVPGSAKAFIDVRFTPETSMVSVIKSIQMVKKNFNGISVKVIVSGHSSKIDPKNHFVQTFSKIAYDNFKIKTTFAVSHGSSDARFFAVKNIPVILINPEGDGAHSDKEWIDLKDLERFYFVMKKFVQQTTKI